MKTKKSGKFIIRADADLHQDLTDIAAESEESLSLNQLVTKVLSQYVKKYKQKNLVVSD